MSPEGKRLGDVHTLPSCAPEGLKALVTIAEGIIHDQVELLGSGKPSKASDPRSLLREQGLEKPEDQSTMIDKYTEHKAEVDKVKSDYQDKDQGVEVETTGIGKVVTDAYDAIEESVGELNGKIDGSHKAIRTWRDDKGVDHEYLPQEIIDGVFTAVWDSLDTTFKQVSGVSDQAAAAALKIVDDEPDFPPGNNNTGGGGGGGIQPVSYNGPSSGNTPWSSNRSPVTAAPLSKGEERDLVMKMMDRLVNQLGFTPAQAAGIIGNAKHESNFNTNAEGDLDLADTAHGLFQWRGGRWAGLQKYAADNNLDLDAWETQIDYMAHELRTNGAYQKAENLIEANKDDPAAVAEAFDRYYEISSGSSTNDRRQYAADTLETWNNAQQTAAV